MRSSFLSSVLFAVLATASVAVSAAPTTAPSAALITAPAVQTEQSSKTNLNTADAETLQKQLTGIGSAKAVSKRASQVA